MSEIFIWTDNIEDQNFTGNEIRPEFAIRVSIGGKQIYLEDGKDFVYWYKNNINFNKYYNSTTKQWHQLTPSFIYIKGIGNYSGLINKPFYIEERTYISSSNLERIFKGDDGYGCFKRYV